MNKRNLIIWLALSCCIVTICPVVAAEDASSWPPVYNPTLEAKPVEGRISVDGDLSDSGWRNAAFTDRFFEHQPKHPSHRLARSEPSEAAVGQWRPASDTWTRSRVFPA